MVAILGTNRHDSKQRSHRVGAKAATKAVRIAIATVFKHASAASLASWPMEKTVDPSKVFETPFW
jgi:hypothetical protein